MRYQYTVMRHAGNAARALTTNETGSRGLHILDPENLLGGKVTAARMTRLMRVYTAGSGYRVGDLAVVGLGLATARHRSLFDGVPTGWRGVVGGLGPDAADVALLDAVRGEDFGRFDAIYVGSGDHALDSVVVSARTAGCRIVLVTGLGQPARVLLDHCTSHIRLPISDSHLRRPTAVPARWMTKPPRESRTA